MLDKEQHEDKALASLVAALTAQGYAAAVTARPDQIPDHPLTVDAIVTIDGVDWAVEHSLLSREGRLVPATDEGERALQRPLEKIARQYGCALVVSYQPQTRENSSSYYPAVIELARAAASSGEPCFTSDSFTSVFIAPDSPAGQVALISFQTSTGNPLLSAQICEGIGTALARKFARQLKGAKDAGYPVMLLLDQERRPDSRNGTVWQAAHGSTVLAGIQPVLDRHPGIIDMLWWRPWGGTAVQLLSGTLPPPQGST
ncbi:hypothetical protein [Streptomyces sp. TLI_146]|uniref:hypothetical protein n=1 Tax=Streptomyces sp. TLI_146 TaxID=1938858 RepID=UPI000C71056E|nr:hypothetical protein [Streptomyces sp. TLI_146]PKV77098.1 hypothetical protein BX283_8031 [Streptomyces sp. TLI_146]